MRRIVVTVLTICVAVILSSLSLGYSQEKSFSVNGGIAKALGEGSEFFNVGFSIGGNGFAKVSPNFAIGGRLAYNRIGADTDALKEEFGILEEGFDVDINVDVSGSISIIEIVPAVRIFPSATETQSINFFGQAGVGLFLLKAKSEVSGTISDPFFGTVTIDEKVDESESKVGLSLGAGITVGKVGSTQIEILPLYHIVFTENESTKYFSVNVGVVFGK